MQVVKPEYLLETDTQVIQVRQQVVDAMNDGDPGSGGEVRQQESVTQAWAFEALSCSGSALT